MSASTRIDQSAVLGHPPEDREHRDSLGWPPVIDGDARIEAFVSVDAGTKRSTVVGPGAWLMKHVHIGHDAVVGAGCELAPGAVVCGWAVIEHGARIGVNAVILPYRRVGANARVGAGAVVTRDVPAGAVVVGNPARMLADDQRDPRPFTERGA